MLIPDSCFGRFLYLASFQRFVPVQREPGDQLPPDDDRYDRFCPRKCARVRYMAAKAGGAVGVFGRFSAASPDPATNQRKAPVEVGLNHFVKKKKLNPSNLDYLVSDLSLVVDALR